MNTSTSEDFEKLSQTGESLLEETEKLRAAVDALLTWIRDNCSNITLPCSCIIFASGDFIRTGLSNPPHGHHETILSIKIGQKYTQYDLNAFAQLISEGFLEKLYNLLEERRKAYVETRGKIQTALTELKK